MADAPHPSLMQGALVAIHLACESLRRGECDLALAGGATLMVLPDPMVYACKLRALSRDGRCKSFDASDDGYARAEGGGVVALKRLSDALKARDRRATGLAGRAGSERRTR